jgi:hypothetical protein
VPFELPECFAGSGASGSTFAMRTGFVTGLVAPTVGLSTDFFEAGFVAEASFFDGALSVPFTTVSRAAT